MVNVYLKVMKKKYMYKLLFLRYAQQVICADSMEQRLVCKEILVLIWSSIKHSLGQATEVNH